MAGIYIKGMKMPSRNAAYSVLFRVNADGTAQLQGSYADDFGSYDAISVPTHGRLIDADALVRDNGIDEIPEYNEVVLNAPTVIPAESVEEDDHGDENAH